MYRTLASGTHVEQTPTGHWTPATPHPDFPDGCTWTGRGDADCCAPVFTIPGNPGGFRCSAGHEHLDLDGEGAPATGTVVWLAAPPRRHAMAA